MNSGNSKSLVNQSYPGSHLVSDMNTVVAPGFGDQHREISNGQLYPPVNPREKMYPVPYNQNHNFPVQLSSSVTNDATFYQIQSADFGVDHQSSVMTPTNPGYHMYQTHDQAFGVRNPAGNQMHQTQNQGFSAYQSQGTTAINPYQMDQIQGPGSVIQLNPVSDNEPLIHNQGCTYPDNSFQQQQVMNVAVNRPAAQVQQQQGQVEIYGAVNQPAAQARQKQGQVETNVGNEHLVVQLDESLFPVNKPRLRWSPELQRRFTRAVEELGGYFKAKPKKILQKMNVTGVTQVQLQSHLQKARNKVLHGSSAKKITAPSEDVPANNFGFEDYDWSPLDNDQDLGLALVDEPGNSLYFKDFNSQNLSDNPNVGIAPAEDPPSNFKFDDFDLAPKENQNLGLVSAEDHAGSSIFEDFDLLTFLESPNVNQSQGIAPVMDHASEINTKDLDLPTTSQSPFYHQNPRNASAEDNAKDIGFKDSDFISDRARQC